MATEQWEYQGEDWKENERGWIPEGWDAIPANGRLPRRFEQWARSRIGIAYLESNPQSVHRTVWRATELLTTDEIRECLQWRAAETLNAGDVESTGSWCINVAIACYAIRYQFRRVRRENDSRVFQTLDEWLRADMIGNLEYEGDYGGMEAVDLVDGEIGLRLVREKKRRAKSRRSGKRTKN